MAAHTTDQTTPTPTPAPARLTRARDDRVVAGVCGGLGRYLGIDPILLRVVLVVLVLLGGTGILAYIIAWIVIPEEPVAAAPQGQGAPTDLDPSGMSGHAPPPPPSGARGGATMLGVLLITVGTLLLVDRLIPGLSWRFTGPVVLVAIGVFVLTKGRSR